MFKGHPKGLFVLALTNMGERFGYYTMLAIFALYLQARFSFTPTQTSLIYSSFLAMVYFLPLFGGFIADRFLGYGKSVLLGIGVMFAGYTLLALPIGGGETATGFENSGFYMMILALLCIAMGTGFFKGNLQAMVGNIYDDPKYSAKRDVAFSIFYMFINIGAFFAPSAAAYVSNSVLSKDNLKYEAKVPDLALKYLNYQVTDSTTFRKTVLLTADKKEAIDDVEGYIKQQKRKQSVLYPQEKERISAQLEESGQAQMGASFTDARDFALKYTQSLARSYRWGFAVACFSLVLSALIFLIFRKTHKKADITEREKEKDKSRASEVVTLTPQQTRQRLIALGLVFFVVIFFWMSFHQNGLTLTFFARDYTNLSIGPGMSIWFNLAALIPFIIGFYGLLSIFQNKAKKAKIIGACIAVAAALVMFYIYKTAGSATSITPPIFQQFNPFFIILLTPLFVAFFAWLNNRGKEPSAPRKIGIGMIIAAIGFIIMIFASIGQQSPAELEGTSQDLLSPNWLISTYFVLTMAELFLSPMGISFVSRVAPPKYKGLMQGGWFAATAIGNYLVGVMGVFWDKLPLWTFWTVLVCCCLLSAAFIFSVMGKLEHATKDS